MPPEEQAGTATTQGSEAQGDRSNIEQNSATKPEEAAAPPTVEALATRLAAVEAEKAELSKFAKGAVARAEKADEYVARMTESLHMAAANASNRGTGEERVSLEDRMREDPLSVMDEHYRARTAPIVESVTRTQAALSQQLATQRWKSDKLPGTDKTVYEVYGKELEDFMGKMPDATKADAGVYDAALNWVRAQHIDDEIKMRTEAVAARERREFVEGPGASGRRGPAAKTLSDLEKEVAKGLGMEADEYVKYRDGAEA